jgi:G3E family GTPase
MSYAERIQYQSFVDNQEYIEGRWHKQWGDRMNELVFIGQDLDKEKILADLEKCLLQDLDQAQFESKNGFTDPFPKEI